MNNHYFFRYVLALAFGAFLLSSCAKGPTSVFREGDIPLPPDYSDETYWAALPTKSDNADRTPKGLTDQQATAKADVFYVHPTMYYGKRRYKHWNAPLDDKSVNKDVDNTTLLYQASCFNAAGRIYAPRYRQAHIRSYGHQDQASAKKAFEIAYSDVKNAFLHYIEFYNDGRPFIIASHSQGTTHCQRLIAEVIDGTDLQDRFVVGYLVGIPVDLSQYDNILPCSDSTDTGCIVGWRTWLWGSHPRQLTKEEGYDVLITNPLTWTSDTLTAPKSLNLGAVLTDFEAYPTPQLVNAKIYSNILWCNKPKFRGSWLLRTKNYHRGDINLYYMNIRQNALQRVNSWMKNSMK